MRIFVVLMLAALGCKPSSSGQDAAVGDDLAMAANADFAYAAGSGSATGSVGGHTLTVRDSYSYDESYVTGGQGKRIAIKLTDFTGACGLQQMNDSHKQNSQYLKLAVTFQGMVDIPTGTYMIGTITTTNPPQVNSGEFKYLDATCTSGIKTAVTGTITLATKSDALVTGMYSLDFGGETLTGSFTSPTCYLPTGQTQACVP
jgi:hypothetical protein